MNKKDAGKLGGQATAAKYGREHMRAIGRRGAAVTRERYTLKPAGVSDFAMIDRKTGQVKAWLSGRPW